MNKKHLHNRYGVLLLLLCMLKVAFPVGEFFHKHLTEKELCAIASGDECHHKAHFSSINTHYDCIFLQLHQYFIGISVLHFLIELPTEVTTFFLQNNIYQTTSVVFSRGPPANLVVNA